MQDRSPLSLNALRVFEAAARRRSMKRAAQDLGVTAGAVSHQVRALENQLGVALFQRSNNAVDLTEAGARLFNRAAPALAMLESALADIQRDANEITVQAPTSPALRWLVPRLDHFRSRYPRVRVHLETFTQHGPAPGPMADVALCYYPGPDLPEAADVLIKDRCRPYVSPTLLNKLDQPRLDDIPALQCADANWDWTLWLSKTGQPDLRLTWGHRFDLDDAGVHAAIAGMGMVLSSDFLVGEDTRSGRLVPMPGAPSAVLGAYTIARNGRSSGLAEAFVRWLRTTIETMDP